MIFRFVYFVVGFSKEVPGSYQVARFEGVKSFERPNKPSCEATYRNQRMHNNLKITGDPQLRLPVALCELKR